MTTKEIAFYYKNLPNGEKGRFTAHISLELGGSPHSWQQKFLKWLYIVFIQNMDYFCMQI